MAGNYDDIIRQVLNDASQNGQVPLMDVPPTTARVPPDTMVDYPYSIQDLNVGRERSPPVFSEQEWKQQMLWNRMDTNRMLNEGDPTGGHTQKYMDSIHEYGDSQLDPDRLINRREGRLTAESANSPIDANVMMKAIENRQRRGRK